MKLFKRLAVASASLATSLTVMVAPAAAVAPSVVYNNIGSPTPGNVISLGYEAASTSEFGGQVELSGVERTNPKVTVLMSSWGCENGNWYSADCVTTPGTTFSHPVTLNIYSVGTNDVPGTVLVTSTKVFDIPYRPSTTLGCSDGRWSKNGGVTCFNGLAVPISFDLTTTLPSKVIVSVAYNTSHHGYSPMTELACYSESGGCGYDSLNVGAETDLSAGSLPVPDKAYLNSKSSIEYCNSALPTGEFRLDGDCWTDYQPSFKIEAKTAAATEQCKNNGWKTFSNPKFKNQGDCVSFIATKGNNLASF